MIDTLAVAGMCGLPVQRMVSAPPIESELWARVTSRAGDLMLHLIKYQSNLTAYNILKGMK